MNLFRVCTLFFLLLGLKSVSGIIIIGGGNSVNDSDPGTGAPWAEVARVTNVSGSHKSSGSAIHLGGGYMLTANHVSLAQGYVSFDGTNTLPIASGSSIQVTSGTDVIDLKIFQLAIHPGTVGVNLFPESAKGLEAAFGAATQIGWGVGHQPDDSNNPWSWGDASTSVKRWGLNEFSAATMISYSHGQNYQFEALVTALDADASENEAAATLYDSGSGLFIKDAADNWFLTGTIVTVSTADSSNFGTAGDQDLNYSVRIGEYADEISALMTDPIPVPEPAVFAQILALSCMLLLNRRRGPSPSGIPDFRRSL